MTYAELAMRLFKQSGIEYEVITIEHTGAFKGVRNGVEWRIYYTSSWDNCYQLTIGDYYANRITIRTAIKKILAL